MTTIHRAGSLGEWPPRGVDVVPVAHGDFLLRPVWVKRGTYELAQLSYADDGCRLFWDTVGAIEVRRASILVSISVLRHVDGKYLWSEIGYRPLQPYIGADADPTTWLCLDRPIPWWRILRRLHHRADVRRLLEGEVAV